MQASSFTTVLLLLQENGVEFMLVGGLAAVLHGAPIQTFDIDVVYSRSITNVKRILESLNVLDAIFRIQPSRRIRPNATHLAARGHLNLLTRFGPLDLLATIGDGYSYEDLLPHSQEILITESVRIRVLNLEQIIAIKEKLGTEKDVAVLPILRQTAREIKKRSSEKRGK